MAHDAVGDEVAGAGRDIEEPHRLPERLDCDHAELRIAFDRATFQPELAPDRRVGEVEEPQLLLETAEDADVRHPVVTTAFLGAVAEPELP